MAFERLNRRRMLLLSAGFTILPGMVRAAVPRAGVQRLHLLNAHTGETFDGPYRDGQAPTSSAMADLSVFLRDFHSGAQIPMDVGVIDFLAAVMDAVGTHSATILSAYRTPETNAMLARTTFGVAEHSQHMFGRALDVRIEGELSTAMQAARAMQRGGVGWYPQSGFLHIDTGPVRNWDLNEYGISSILFLRPETRSNQAPISPYDVNNKCIIAKWANSGRVRPTFENSGRLLPQVASRTIAQTR